MGLMTASGGLTNRKLALATATPDKVSADATYYARDKTLKTGTLVERGTAQNAGGIGSGGSGSSAYIAFNRIPEGIYRANGTDWGPEIRAPKSTVLSTIGPLTVATELGNQTLKGDNSSHTFNISIVQGHLYIIFTACHSTAAPNVTYTNLTPIYHVNGTFRVDNGSDPSGSYRQIVLRANITGTASVTFRIYSGYASGNIRIVHLN